MLSEFAPAVSLSEAFLLSCVRQKLTAPVSRSFPAFLLSLAIFRATGLG